MKPPMNTISVTTNPAILPIYPTSPKLECHMILLLIQETTTKENIPQYKEKGATDHKTPANQHRIQ